MKKITSSMLLFTLFLVKVATAQNARVQVIHNSPDLAAQQVDVYINDVLALDNFAFRTATPFISLPAGVPVSIDVLPSNSTSSASPLYTLNTTLTSNETYILVANGIVSPTGYSVAPNFAINVFAQGREAASNPIQTDVLVNHGSPDAPVVDVVETSVPAGTVVNDIAFPQFQGYLELPNVDFILDVRDATGTTTVASYLAPLQTLNLDGAAITVLASGFLNPATNSNGPAFGLWVATAAGGNLIPLPAAPNARVQVIHNSPDLAAQQVDVYINDVLALDNFAFRTATPFISLPAGVPVSIDVLPSNSTSSASPLYTLNTTLTANETYILVANGIVSPTGYSVAPNFAINVFAQGREAASNPIQTDVLVNHGSPDAPVVDVVETSVPAGTVVNDIAFPQFQGYLELPNVDFILDVRDATGTTTVASYSAPLQTLNLDGAAITVLASGFLNPATNSNGPAFGLWVATAAGGNLIPLPAAPNARVQVIHNSPDLAAQQVDVYINDVLALDNFAFRTATPFISLPAGVPVSIDVLPSNSTSSASPLYTLNTTLTANETYILVANGIVSPTGYSVAPNFAINVFAQGREAASNPIQTDVLVNHGSPDAPVVDVVETSVPAGTVVNDIAFPQFQGYLELPNVDFILDVRDATGTTTVASYSAPLQTLNLDGAAITVLASGFLNPATNSNGPAFGLWVATAAGGNLIPLPAAPNARVQVIHNSPDLAAQQVDVYINDVLALDNFAFRTATPFISLPAGVPVSIDVLPSNSTSSASPLYTLNTTLTSNETYILVANGIVSPTGYSVAPNFAINVFAQGREAASNPIQTDVLVNHGSPDAPVVDVVETSVPAGTVVNDIAFPQFQGYLELPNLDFILDVRDATGTTTVASYSAPLQTLNLDGAAITVLASGFLNPATNSNGPAFGLWVATAAGGNLIPLPAAPNARVQVIHNSPDLAAQQVDVYINDVLALDNFAFRTATPFITLPAGVPVSIDVLPSNSTSSASPLYTLNTTLTANETYILVANGIVSPTGYSVAPNFAINVFAQGREVASNPIQTDVLVNHGSPDAPVVDVVETSVPAGTVVNDIAFPQFQGYLELPNVDFILDVRDATGTTTVASYLAPLQTLNLDGAAITVLASGFLNPATNSNGPAFGLWVATAAGGNLIPLPVNNLSVTTFDQNAIVVYPNPAANLVTIEIPSNYTELQTSIYDLNGRKVIELPANTTTIDVSNLMDGMYVLGISIDNVTVNRKLVIKR